DAIARFAYQPIATLYLQCDMPVLLNEPLLQLDGSPGQWLFDRGALGGPRGLYAVVISAASSARGVDQDETSQAVLDQLRRVWPAWPRPRWAKLIMQKRATFACTAGLARPPAGR